LVVVDVVEACLKRLPLKEGCGVDMASKEARNPLIYCLHGSVLDIYQERG
jgi:hypothetical protein